MRCDGCDGKFGSNGEPEVEVDSEDINATSLVAECTVNVPCANCGGDFKIGYVSLEADAEGETGGCSPACAEDAERVFEITETVAEVADDYRPKTRLVRGREVPVAHRYRRHYYDVTVTWTIQCSHCDSTATVSATESLSAGELEAA